MSTSLELLGDGDSCLRVWLLKWGRKRIDKDLCSDAKATGKNY
jgi:hypothetical protein